MKHPLPFLLVFLIATAFFGQTANAQLFSESNYTFSSKGLDTANSYQTYAIKYRSTIDTAYTLKKTYSDSLYTQLLSKAFYKGSLLDGPYFGYALDTSRTQPLARFPNMLVEEALAKFPVDTILVTAFYKDGKLVGERLTHRGDKLVQQGSFTNGVRVGEWKDFNGQGQVRRKTIYNNKGRKISEETNQ